MTALKELIEIDGLKFALELAEDKLRKKLMASGVSNETQARLLVAVRDGINTYDGITVYAGISVANMKREMNPMLRAGLIERKQAETGKCNKLLIIMPKGQAAINQLTA